VLALLHGFIYAAVIPPWQSPDEHGHFEYAWLVSQHGPFVGPESISPEFQQRVLESMSEYDFWRLVHQPTPESLPSGFTDPSDHILSLSNPQVGDERPLYYLVVGGLLRLTGVQDVLGGMYIGRLVSVLLYATAVGLTALTTGKLFPQSLFMQVVPPAFVLFLPMLGQMGAAVNSDAMGILTSTLFFASLIPVFRDGLTWPRAGATVGALILALLSKKTTLFLVPTALLTLPTYAWTWKIRLSRQIKSVLAAGTAFLTVTGLVLALTPGNDAVGWTEWTGNCGGTRLKGEAYKGEAAIRIGTCADEVVAQTLPQGVVEKIVGQQVILSGQVRGAAGPTAGEIAVWDSEGYSKREIDLAMVKEWYPIVLTHTVAANARWVAVRLSRSSGGPILFDDLTLSLSGGDNLLFNSSAEQRESLLLDLLANTARRVGAPLRLMEQLLLPESWSLRAWQEYVMGALFCLHSFWGNFGWLALPLLPSWYWAAEIVCALAMVGNVAFVASKSGRGWQAGYLFTLMGGVLLLALQTLLPLVSMRGTYWLPQGRYLFPGIFAIVVLMARGLRQLLPRQQWGNCVTAIAIGVSAGFDLACLGYLILPYFHG